MDAEQRYIEESKYGLDQQFIDSLTDVPIVIAMKIARFMDRCYPQLDGEDGDHKLYGAVVHFKGEPTFFSVEVFFDVDMPYLLDFKLITVDEYLDFILIKNYLKNEHRFSKKDKDID